MLSDVLLGLGVAILVLPVLLPMLDWLIERDWSTPKTTGPGPQPRP